MLRVGWGDDALCRMSWFFCETTINSGNPNISNRVINRPIIGVLDGTDFFSIDDISESDFSRIVKDSGWFHFCFLVGQKGC